MPQPTLFVEHTPTVLAGRVSQAFVLRVNGAYAGTGDHAWVVEVRAAGLGLDAMSGVVSTRLGARPVLALHEDEVERAEIAVPIGLQLGSAVMMPDGLALRFGLQEGRVTGFATQGTRFGLEVSQNQSAHAAFDGSDGVVPFDGAVTPGHFCVNGTRTEVHAQDNFHGVLRRLSASRAGVVASYDVATGVVRLDRIQGPQEHRPITLGADTSGLIEVLGFAPPPALSAAQPPAQPSVRERLREAGVPMVAFGMHLVDGLRAAVNHLDAAATVLGADVHREVARHLASRVPATRYGVLTRDDAPGAVVFVDEGQVLARAIAADPDAALHYVSGLVADLRRALSAVRDRLGPLVRTYA